MEYVSDWPEARSGNKSAISSTGKYFTFMVID
jgi:hypothetical protein